MSGRHLANKRARGLSLVELLVAITLGAIILGGAVTLFVNNRDTYKTTNELSRLQETARYALDMMVKDIRMAGYFGCADRLDTVNGNFTGVSPGDLWNPVNPIEGWEGDTAGNYLPSNDPFVAGTRAYGSVLDNVADGADGINGQVLARGGINPDSITLRYLAGDMSNLLGSATVLDHTVTADVPTGGGVINVDAVTGLAVNQVVGISDCGGSDIFQMTALTSIAAAPPVPEIITSVTSDPAETWSRGYNAASNPMLAPYVGVRYYIGASGRSPDPVNDPYPSLYRTVIFGTGPGAMTETAQELFEGVESMQILYGVDEDADGAPNRYVRASDPPLDVAANWANVVSVRLAIIVRTVDQVGQVTDLDTATYAINDHDGSSGARPVFNPTDDRRRRRVFTTTAQVRNL